MDPAFLIGLCVWASGVGFGWLWRHYSWRHYREAYDRGYDNGIAFERHRMGVRYTDE